jgi:circadian clock protein KaiB
VTATTERCELTLFVGGASDLSARAIRTVRRLCDTQLGGTYSLAVIDVHEQPATAAGRRVLATPALVRTSPLPVRQVVGDLSDTAKVLLALGLEHT